MKTSTLRLSAAALAAALLGSIGCSTGGCSQGGTNLNDNGGSTGVMQVKCGSGTHLNSHNQCVANSSTNSNGNTNTNGSAVNINGH